MYEQQGQPTSNTYFLYRSSTTYANFILWYPSTRNICRVTWNKGQETRKETRVYLCLMRLLTINSTISPHLLPWDFGFESFWTISSPKVHLQFSIDITCWCVKSGKNENKQVMMVVHCNWNGKSLCPTFRCIHQLKQNLNTGTILLIVGGFNQPVERWHSKTSLEFNDINIGKNFPPWNFSFGSLLGDCCFVWGKSGVCMYIFRKRKV